MTDHSMQRPKNMFLSLRHVTLFAAFVLVSVLSTVRSEKAQVPSRPESSFDFSAADTDGSGCVEGAEELQKFRLHVGKVLGDALNLPSIERALRAGRITHSADVNGDGKICECDLLSILLTESTGPGMHRHAFRVYEDGSIFDAVDADSDGFLDDVTEQEELAQKLAQCVADVRARGIVDAMSKLEVDDGKVSRTEYLLFLKPPQSAESAAPTIPQPAGPLQPQPVNQAPQPVPDSAGSQREVHAADNERQIKPSQSGLAESHPQPVEPTKLSVNQLVQPLNPASQPDPRAMRQPGQMTQPVHQAAQRFKFANQPAQPAVQPDAQPLLAASVEASEENVDRQPLQPVQAGSPAMHGLAQPAENQAGRMGAQGGVAEAQRGRESESRRKQSAGPGVEAKTYAHAMA